MKPGTAESGNEYEADEFEKEDLVQLAEPPSQKVAAKRGSSNAISGSTLKANRKSISIKATINETSRGGAA